MKYNTDAIIEYYLEHTQNFIYVGILTQRLCLCMFICLYVCVYVYVSVYMCMYVFMCVLPHLQ